MSIFAIVWQVQQAQKTDRESTSQDSFSGKEIMRPCRYTIRKRQTASSATTLYILQKTNTFYKVFVIVST
jgi:hypothetical protein